MNIIDMARQAGFITDFGCRETASDECLLASPHSSARHAGGSGKAQQRVPP